MAFNLASSSATSFSIASSPAAFFFACSSAAFFADPAAAFISSRLLLRSKLALVAPSDNDLVVVSTGFNMPFVQDQLDQTADARARIEHGTIVLISQPRGCTHLFSEAQREQLYAPSSLPFPGKRQETAEAV